jgi:hypothetical protein
LSIGQQEKLQSLRQKEMLQATGLRGKALLFFSEMPKAQKKIEDISERILCARNHAGSGRNIRRPKK